MSKRSYRKRKQRPRRRRKTPDQPVRDDVRMQNPYLFEPKVPNPTKRSFREYLLENVPERPPELEINARLVEAILQNARAEGVDPLASAASTDDAPFANRQRVLGDLQVSDAEFAIAGPRRIGKTSLSKRLRKDGSLSSSMELENTDLTSGDREFLRLSTDQGKHVLANPAIDLKSLEEDRLEAMAASGLSIAELVR